jgi:hypothetical protein
MRPSDVLTSLAATVFTAFFLVAIVTMAPDLAHAAEAPATPATEQPRAKLQTPCSCSRGELGTATSNTKPSPFRQHLDRTPLDITDEVAALDAVRIALNEVGDGGSYVWQRAHGRLSGVVQPTASFRDTSGQPCRHIIMMLSTATVSKKTEGIACRQPGGNWQLEG